jgi:hypothetical protein
MIMSPCKRNRNDPFGRIAAGGEYGREITNGIEGIVEGKTDETGEAEEDAIENGSPGVESELPVGEADLRSIPERGRAGAGPRQCGEALESEAGGGTQGTDGQEVSRAV